MFVRQCPKYGMKEWLNEKVRSVEGKLFYTNKEYINHFTNTIMEMAEKYNYKIKDPNRLRDDITVLLYKVSDNI